jgi:polar amino acid transport system permease protein
MVTLIAQNWTVLLDGLIMTLIVSGVALLTGCPLGLLLAEAGLSGGRVAAAGARAYGSFWRGTPILVQLLIVFYLPSSFGFAFAPVVAAVVALALNTAAFQAEIYRAGLQAIPRGEIEAARLLGLGRWQILVRIEAPQAFRMVLPALVGEALALVKNSSLVSVIAVTEITRRAQQIASATFRPLEAYSAALLAYLAIAAVLAGAGLLLERRLANRGGRS